LSRARAESGDGFLQSTTVTFMNPIPDLEAARNDVSGSSMGGAPFLISFGATLFITAILSLFVPVRIAALVAMFQGGVALPVAFWLEARIGNGPMAADNPLRSLSVQLAMSQVVALPAVIVAYSLNPASVPVVLAAIAGGHFLPYAWLQRTRIYVVLAVAIAVGALALQIGLGTRAFPAILLYMSLLYWISAPMLYRHAARLSGTPATAKS
jgi:hypothetical protein